MKKRISLEEKFVIFIAVTGILCFGLLGIFTYRQVGDMMITQYKETALSAAETAAAEIDGDLFLSITSPENEAYQEIYTILDNQKNHSIITYTYALLQQGDKVLFVIDTDEENPADFMEPYPLTEDMKPAFQGKTVESKRYVSDKWGDYYSAFAPIRNKEGLVVGIVGADIGISHFQSVLSQLKNMIVVLITIFAGCSILIYILVSNSLMGKDLLTEINNYDKLIKYGKAKEKRKQLCRYTGVLINIKDFSYINQTLGAVGGDMILKLYASELKKRVKSSEFLASTGGDSYFALIKNNRIQDFLDSLENITLRISVGNESMQMQVPARCGVYPIPEKAKINDVLNCCTVALNAAKLSYNNDTKWFEKSMFDEMLKEREVLNAFRTGLARKEFIVYYQPKVNLNTNDLCGAEALVRWFRNGKLVPPDQFIPILEKNNLIVDLDFYVFEKVCTDIRDWLDRGLTVVPISSNFSKMHLRNADFADRVLSIKDKYCVDAKYIDTELTESSGFYDLDALINFVTRMNEADIAVSIDDFGTGFSSLSLLKDLNVDIVKMDKSFFRAMEKGEKTQEKMVANVIRMVQDLNRQVISEGIETRKQAEFLRNLHSPIVQGFLFDKPLPHNEFEKRLKEPHYTIFDEAGSDEKVGEVEKGHFEKTEKSEKEEKSEEAEKAETIKKTETIQKSETIEKTVKEEQSAEKLETAESLEAGDKPAATEKQTVADNTEKREGISE